MELGRDFDFAEEEYRVQVGKKVFPIDPLLFQRSLSCLVAFELEVSTPDIGQPSLASSPRALMRRRPPMVDGFQPQRMAPIRRPR